MKIQSAKAGIGTGRAGLQAASGLFSSAGLFQKGVKSFHPNDLDPYLLFDAESSMIGTLENPTLDLDPATPSTLDVITATRSSVATRTLSDGTIALAEQDTVRVDYTQGAELTPTVYQHFGYTDFSSGWSGIRTETEQGANHLGFPSRLITRINESSTSSGTYYFVPSSLTDGQTYRYSLYIRRITGTSDINLRHRYAVEGTDSLVSVTEDWQRFEVSATKAVGSNIQFGVTIADFGDQIEIAMPQVEEGTTASDFVANTTGSPKFITGATYGPRVPMILVEPSATNSFLYSQPTSALAFGNSATKTFNDAIAPNGEIEAFRITHNGASGSVNFRATSSITFGSDSMVLSVWAKAGSGGNNYFTWSFQNLGGAVVRAGFKLEGDGETQLITSGNGGHTLQIETYPDGWYRCIIIGNTQSSGTTTQFLYTVSGYNESSSIAGGSVLLWGFQVETGSVATSYIPTSGSTAQRAADDLVISGSAFSNFYNASEGTIYAETIISPSSQPSGDYLWSINDGGYTNRIVSVYDTRLYNYVISSNAINFVNATAVSSLDEIMRTALSYKTNNALHSVNGVTSTPDTSVTLPSGLNKLNLGQDNASGNTMTGRFKRLIYWPYHSDSL